MSTVLLTCGRGTFSLTLARAFHAAGHRVLVADAWPRSLCRYSAAVARYFYVPSPAKSTTAWAEAIQEIVKQQRVDLIVPIYEEVLHLAKALADLAEPLPLFAADFQTLIALHDKWRFNQTARALGLSVPDSVLLTSREDVEREFARGGRNRVFKPVYSRFAAQTVVRPAESRIAGSRRADSAKAVALASISSGTALCDFQHRPSRPDDGPRHLRDRFLS